MRGPTVFPGYWNLPAATADSFADGGWFKWVPAEPGLPAAQCGHIVAERCRSALQDG